MKIIAPDCYPRFSCLMGACRHSCCIGWEIDIDEDSLERFRSTGGEIGRKLKENIIEADGCACFRLTEDERCPFLNADGLCCLILELGEDCLCQICADHPRFRSFFSGHEEIGLGLCCEAAAQLMLKNPEKAGWMVLEDDGCEEEYDPYEQDLLGIRSELIAIMQDRSKPVLQRIECIPICLGMNLPKFSIHQWKDFLLSLERLDNAWTEKLERISLSPAFLPQTPEWEIALEQLAVYLLQRHIPGALEDGDLAGRIAFCVLAVLLLHAICAAQHDAVVDDFCDLARMFSAEIEYSDENIRAILDELHRRHPEL